MSLPSPSVMLSLLSPRLYLPLMVSLLIIGLALLGEQGREWLAYRREWMVTGEVWRLFTAHLTHTGWNHLWLNFAGLWLIWWLVGSAAPSRHWWVLLPGSALFISLGLWVFNPNLGWYVGLSGVLHTLLFFGALHTTLQRDISGWFLVLLTVVKLGWEQWQGATPGSSELIGAAVVVDAHLYGAIAGLLALPLSRWAQQRQALATP